MTQRSFSFNHEECIYEAGRFERAVDMTVLLREHHTLQLASSYSHSYSPFEVNVCS